MHKDFNVLGNPAELVRKLKITENEKYTLYGREIWRGKLKKVENFEMSTVGRGIWKEN